MSPKLYLDTGPFKGLLDPHDRSRELFKRATEARVHIYTPYPALLELHRLLTYRKPPRSDAARLATAALRRVIATYPAVYPTEAPIPKPL